ncbi:NUP145 [[Candida] subhashii]|uniref:NUP145 n=1 Tax=[Candida] subhashii TaxID=561895 RepID=A0A8J5UF43_9ASCO|nr:NUP145 [[Candida] subhashii]KAG7661728.1 NUP145 [[Candida] subhashii]
MFGSSSTSNNNNNNWAASTGFGATTAARRASIGGPPPTGTTSSLFGNSTNNPTISTNSDAGGSLPKRQNTSVSGGATGGLFGNSLSNGSAPASGGGLFGNSNTSTGGGGLFGQTGTTTGTSGAAAPATSGGLFGNRSTTTTQPSGGLFGNSATTTQPTSFFGGGSNQAPVSNGGLFGKPPSGGLSGGLFGNQQSQQQQPSFSQLTVNNTNGISIVVQNRLDVRRKRRFSYLEPEKQKPTKSSLLSKLGQTFRFIRNGTTGSSLQSSIKGLFTQSDVVNIHHHKQKKPGGGAILSSQFPVVAPNKNISRPSYKAIDSRRVGSMKRLIIKSKPVKYHLIDVNKVFNAKRRKTVVENVVTADKLLSEKYLSDEDESDDDEGMQENRTFLRYPYKVSTSDSKKQNGSFSIGDGEPEADNVNGTAEVKETIATESHDGYWSTPTISELCLYCYLLNRLNLLKYQPSHGCGQIAYNYPVDLTQVVLDAKENGQTLEQELFGKIIQISPKVIVTYKDSVKPKPGASAADHIKFLKRQIGMEFITYDPITHVWVFKVKHFSIWGLVEEDDDNQHDEELVAMKRKQDSNETQASIEYSRIYENEKYNQELKKQKLNERTKNIPGRWEYQTLPSENPLNIKRNLVTNEILQELNRYQNDQQELELTAQVSDITIDSEREESPASFANGGDGEYYHPKMEEREYDYLKQMISVLPPGTDIDEIVDEKVYEPEITNDDVFDNIQIKSDQGHRLLTFDDLLFSEFNKESLKRASTPQMTRLETIEDLDMDEEEEDEDIYCNNIPDIFHTLLVNSTIVTRDNKYPKVNVTENFSFNDLVFHPGQLNNEEEQELVQLAIALFDDSKINQELRQIDSSNITLSQVISENTRKESFANWLKKYNQKSINRLLESHKSDPLEQVFIHLCAGNLKQAIETALATNNDHLAVVITLADSNHHAVRSIAANQLNSWKERNVVSLIPKAVVKIYQILASDLDVLLGDLPWNIALALKLFYGDGNMGLKDLINGYKDNLPVHHQVADVLKLYASSKIDLSSISSMSINKKFKWLFCKILISGTSCDDISISFGDYLQSVNYWKEAIIVYSHLSDDGQAQELIRNLVISKVNYIKSNKIDEEEYLVKVLKVPQVVIYEAIAIEKRSLGDFWGECEALIKVQLWERAHATIVGKLGPITVISNSEKDIVHFLDLIDKFPQQGLIIPNWNIGAGVYANYLNLLKDETNVKLLEFLLINVPQVKEKSEFNQKVALKLISRKVGDLVIENDNADSEKQESISKLYLGPVEKHYFDIRLS